MILLVLSDLHLMPEIRTSGTTLTGDCEFAINQLKPYVTQFDPEVVIIAGDIFDQPLVSNEELKLFRMLCDVLDTGRPRKKLCIQGNHDPGKWAIPDICFNCCDIDREPVDIEGARIGGVKYLADAGEMKKRIAERAKNCDIVVTHASTMPFANFNAKLVPDDFPDGKFCIVGDTHLTRYYNRHGKRILSPGYLYPTRKNEFLSNGPGAVLLKVDGPDQVDVYELPLQRRFAAEALNGWPDDSVISQLREHEKDALAPIVYVEKDSVRNVTAALPFVVPVRAVRPKKQDSEKVCISGNPRESVIGKLREAAYTLLKDNPDKDMIVTMIEDLWNTNDPEKYLTERVS